MPQIGSANDAVRTSGADMLIIQWLRKRKNVFGQIKLGAIGVGYATRQVVSYFVAQHNQVTFHVSIARNGCTFSFSQIQQDALIHVMTDNVHHHFVENNLPLMLRRKACSTGFQLQRHQMHMRITAAFRCNRHVDLSLQTKLVAPDVLFNIFDGEYLNV